MDTENSIKKFIVNQLGINLCSVDKIRIEKQADGQLININISFFPNNDNK